MTERRYRQLIVDLMEAALVQRRPTKRLKTSLNKLLILRGHPMQDLGLKYQLEVEREQAEGQ